MTENERRHSERQRRIYDRGEESGKKIKAVSYKLLVISCELKAEAYFPLGVIRNISKGFAVVVRETLSVIRSGGEKFMEELVKTVKRKS